MRRMYLDAVATEQFLKLRDYFGVNHFVETGSAEGNNAIFYSSYFPKLISIENNKELFERALQRTAERTNIRLWHMSSAKGLAEFRRRVKRMKRIITPIFFLDAHGGTTETWPLLEELHALQGFANCCIIIHDFKVEGLGFISYDGQDLDLDYVQERLRSVNPEFHLYTNYPEATRPRTFDELITQHGMPNDNDLKAMLDYAWSTERRLRRGILYAVPKKLDSSFKLKEIVWS